MSDEKLTKDERRHLVGTIVAYWNGVQTVDLDDPPLSMVGDVVAARFAVVALERVLVAGLRSRAASAEKGGPPE